MVTGTATANDDSSKRQIGTATVSGDRDRNGEQRQGQWSNSNAKASACEAKGTASAKSKSERGTRRPCLWPLGPRQWPRTRATWGKQAQVWEGAAFGKYLQRRWGSGSGEERAQGLEDKCKLEGIWPRRETRRDFEGTFDCEVLQLVGEAQDEKQVFQQVGEAIARSAKRKKRETETRKGL